MVLKFNSKLAFIFHFHKANFWGCKEQNILFISGMLNLECFTNKIVDIFILFPVDNTCYKQEI